MMKRIILFCLANILLHCAEGQTFVNNGATVAITQGAVMIVTTDPGNLIPGSGSLENTQPTANLRNAGQLTIEGSFVNDNGAVADGFGTNTGQYRVQGDWENDATFTADKSTVVLYGPIQAIKGTANSSPNPTTFYNLIDTLANSVKTQEVDAFVSDTFSLYSAEHATGDYRLTILNPDTSGIYIPAGDLPSSFVSSTGNGRLVRNTNLKAEYIFPTGISEAGSPKIREASVTPATALPHTYAVRYVDDGVSNNTTTPEGYDTAQKSGYIGEVNDVFFHYITSNGNTDPADYAIYFNPGTDYSWTSLARWQVVPQWQDLQNTVAIADPRGTGRVKIVRPGLVPTTDTAFALVDSVAIKADFAFPTAFVADGQGGIPAEDLYFGIINQVNIVTLQELSVFNRWGEMVFDSKRDGSQTWNGHFNGKLQPEGNYVYRAVVINNQSGKQYPLVTGNVALLW